MILGMGLETQQCCRSRMLLFHPYRVLGTPVDTGNVQWPRKCIASQC